MTGNLQKLLDELAKPFDPSDITWKPGSTTKDGDKCLAMAYADLRAYQERLDALCGLDWSVRYVPWGDTRIMCELTIYVGGPLGVREAVTRASTGEYDAQDAKTGIGGTVAEAQAFKRAAAMFGMGRYLYDLPSVWVEFDNQRKRISDKGKAELDARYRAWYAKKLHANGDDTQPAQSAPQQPATPARSEAQHDPAAAMLIDPLNALGEELYGEDWPQVREHNTKRVSKDRTPHFDELKAAELQTLIEGLNKLKSKRLAETNVATAAPIPH